VKYITFRVARQEFIMDASRIRGLVPAAEVMLLEVPAPWITGIASLRGQDFPVVDLRRKLNIARGSQGRLPVVIAAEVASSSGPRLIGFIADRVSEVLTLRPHDFRKGAIRISGRARLLFDPDSILNEEELLDYWCYAENRVSL
jgi:purine-binding chemotaxis protein CheW